MTKFLSDEWIEALNAQLKSDASRPGSKSLTIQYEISDGADTICYYLALGPHGDLATSGRADDPDVTFRMNKDTAREISEGELSTEEAFIGGRLDLDGDPGPLIEAYHAANDA